MSVDPRAVQVNKRIIEAAIQKLSENMGQTLTLLPCFEEWVIVIIRDDKSLMPFLFAENWDILMIQIKAILAYEHNMRAGHRKEMVLLEHDGGS